MAVPITSSIKRQIRVWGLDDPVIVTLHSHGIEIGVSGYSTRIFGSWEHVARNLLVPESAPSKFHLKPVEFLKYQVAKKKAKAAAKSS